MLVHLAAFSLYGFRAPGYSPGVLTLHRAGQFQADDAGKDKQQAKEPAYAG